MKTSKIVFIALIGFSFFLNNSPLQAQPGYRGNPSFNTFYNELSAYGQWRTVPRYGEVWSYNEPGFRPYATNGQWEYSDMGWTWVSGYDWGWAPFHYGRWELDDYYGWIWIPGYDYAPAWVTWSQADDYYGWAPLGFGLDINISIGRVPYNRWNYASQRYITHPMIGQYCLPYRRNQYYSGRQRAVINIYTNNNVRFLGGPNRREVERITHSTIQPRNFNHIDRGRNNNYSGGNRNNDRDNRPANGPGRNETRPTPGNRDEIAARQAEQERTNRAVENSRERLENRPLIQPRSQPVTQPTQQERMNRTIDNSRERMENRPTIQPQRQPAVQPAQQERTNRNIENSRERAENRPVIQPRSAPVQQERIYNAPERTSPAPQRQVERAPQTSRPERREQSAGRNERQSAGETMRLARERR